VAKDLQDNELDPNKTLEELDLKEICFGVCIIDWIEYKEKEKNAETNEETEDNSQTPRQKQKFGFILDLDKQVPSPTKDPATHHRDSARTNKTLKSPNRTPKTKTNPPRMKGIDYSKIVENLNKQHQTVDEIQFAAQLTSFWHNIRNLRMKNFLNITWKRKENINLWYLFLS